jgi:glycosyltransferase involved in cell wall biosynthesis
MKKLGSLSVFLPCYNEAKNIPRVIRTLFKLLPLVSQRYEVIVINDGSHDQTVKVVEKLQSDYPQLQLVTHVRNLGYGAAVKSGIMAAKYQWLFLTDGDGQFDPQQLTEFIPYTQDYRAVVGYRQVRVEGWRRAFNAWVFKTYIRFLFGIKIRDLDCAFKLFHRSTVDGQRLMSQGAMISTEIVDGWRRRRISFEEVPVRHLPRRFGQPTGNKPSIILKALKESLYLFFKLRTS